MSNNELLVKEIPTMSNNELLVIAEINAVDMAAENDLTFEELIAILNA